MAEEPAWKSLARQQAVEAPGCFERARGLLAGARSDLAVERAVVIDAQARRASAHRAEGMVAEASCELAAAARRARTARLIVLAVHCGAPRGPGLAAPPPLSAKDVPDEALRVALGDLEDAGARAGQACPHAGLCRGYLVAVVRLLDHPRPLPGGVDGFVNAMLAEALGNLDSAETLARESAHLLNDALLYLLA